MSEQRYAIVIGINDYRLNPLRFSVADAERFSQILIQKCRYEHVDLQVSPSEGKQIEIIHDLKTAIQSIKALPGDKKTILFYFSGHAEIENELNLLLHDQPIAVQHIFDLLNEMHPNHITIIIDACYSGFGIDTKNTSESLMVEWIRQWQISSGRSISYLGSSRATETSQGLPELGHGIYTYYLIEAVNKKALYDENELSLLTMHDYAAKKMFHDGARVQIPYKQIEQTGYYPFAFWDENEKKYLAPCKVEVALESNLDDLLSVFDDSSLSASEDLRRDLKQLFFEIAENALIHANANHCTIMIIQNTITYSDNGLSGFNPFEEAPREGKRGLPGIREFQKRYSNSVHFGYEPFTSERNGNKITLSFVGVLPFLIASNPCEIGIEKLYFTKKRYFDHIKIPETCSEILFDFTKCTIAFSIVNSMLEELVNKTGSKKPFLIFKFSNTDMTRNFFAQDIERLSKEDQNRVLLI